MHATQGDWLIVERAERFAAVQQEISGSAR